MMQFDPTHWLAFFEPGSEKEKNGWGDQPHHTGFWVTAQILRGKTAPHQFITGYHIRRGGAKKGPPDTFLRHPLVFTRMNRDQLTPLIFPLHECSIDTSWMIKKYAGLLFPHQWMHFQRSRNIQRHYLIRLFCDFFECLDSISDWFSDSESSQIKNVYRLVIAEHRYPTFLIKTAKWLLTRRVDPWKAMETYFTRKFSDDERPPPVHLEWKSLIDRHF